MLPAIEKQDVSLMQNANARIQEGRNEAEKKWHARLMALYEAHGVKSAKGAEDSNIKRHFIEPVPD
jgi:hypothetical protein